MLASLLVPRNGNIHQAIHEHGKFGLTYTVALHVGRPNEVQQRIGCPSCRLITAALAKSSALAAMIGAEDIFICTSRDEGALLICKAASAAQGSYHDRLLFDQGGSLYGRWVFGPGALLVHSDTYTPGSYGRLVKDIPVDPLRIRRWLEWCDAQHGPSCKPSVKANVSSTASVLRLIDVFDMRIVKQQWSTKYFALSYVWGGIQQLCLLKSNRAALEEIGGLSKEIHRISRTVRDAIEFTKLLGERYLWVDCLCLTNDDAQELRQGISSMFKIYNGAYATVVAANGSTAEAGLPRLYRESRHPERAFENIKPGLSLISVAYLDQCLEHTAWYTRG